MKKIASLAFLLLLASPAWAVDNTVIITPGVGVTMRSIDIGAGVEAMGQVLVGTNGVAIYGTAGTANANVLSVQGIASMTPLLVTASAGTNLNTSLLALEAGGNLASVKTNTDRLLSSATNIVAGSALATTSFVIGTRYLSTPPTFTNGQEGAFQIDANGRMLTSISATSLPLPTGAATSALQGTNTATTAHTCSVAGYSELGCLGQIDDDVKAAIPAGTNRIGFVTLQADTTGGCTPTHVLSAVSTNSTSVKASAAGVLCSVTIINNTATAASFRLYDSAAAPTCSSATGVVANYGVQANTTSPGLSPNLGPYGLAFSSGIGFCLTAYDGTDTNNSNSVTGIQINLAYK